MDIVTLAAARKGGGGGDVTKAYVDDHLALKADKTETAQYPISDTVSGDDISVTGTADANVQKLTVYGRSRVSKNLIPLTVDIIKANNTSGTWNDNVYTINDGTFTIIQDTNNNVTGINVNGTFTATSRIIIPVTLDNVKTYNLSGTPQGGSLETYVQRASNQNVTIYSIDTGNGASIAANADVVRDEIIIVGGYTATNLLFQPMIRLSTDTDPSFEPYFDGIKSIGDSGSLTITTTDGTASSTATLTTGLPLCGIPVNSGETYTDGNGVKWLADTESVDGVVKRCYKITFDGSEDENWTLDSTRKRVVFEDAITGSISTDTPYTMLVGSYDVLSFNDLYSHTDKAGAALSQNGKLSIRVLPLMDTMTTVTEWKNYLSNNPLTWIYELATPTATPLTPAEKSALLSLKTYDPTTNLTVTDDPFVDFGYMKNTENGKAVEQAAENAKKQVINDAAASNATTFSSNKIIDLVSGQPKDYEIYTFRIDHDNSDPDTAVRPFIHGYGCDNYDYQNAGMDYANDVFKYGDWANAFFIKNLKPIYLNRDGSIEYELNKNNYKQKADGTTASEVTDLTSSGNVMVGFPTVWLFRYMSGSYEYVVISNKQLDYRFKAWAHHDKNGNVLPYIYLAAYNGSLSDYDSAVGVSTGKLRSISGVDYHNLNAITNNKILSNATRGEEINFAARNNDAGETGEGWYILHKAEWDMVNDLLILISGTTDTQTAFGNGVISGYVSETNTGIKSTGLYDDKGLFYGKTTQTDPVKVFGIENWWGNQWNSLAGWVLVNGTQRVKMTHGTEDGSTGVGFNTSGTGYVTIPNGTPSGTSGGYNSTWSKSEYGMIPLVVSGTSSTYLCDGLWYNNSDTRFALVGGPSDYSWLCGAFCSSLSTKVGGRSWNVGASLTYKGVA